MNNKNTPGEIDPQNMVDIILDTSIASDAESARADQE